MDTAATSNPGGDDVAADPPEMHFFSPPTANYTRIPNEFFQLLPEIKSASELKVCLVIMRATFGYGEPERLLTIDTLMERTGMARASVVDGVKRAVERGYFGRRRVQKGYVYGARVKAESSGISSVESRKTEPEKVQKPSGSPNKGKKQQKEKQQQGGSLPESTEGIAEYGAERWLFDFWRRETRKGRALFTDKRKSQIKARLHEAKEANDDSSVAAFAEVKEAVEGLANSPWHIEAGRLDFDLVFRNRDRIEQMVGRRQEQLAKSNRAKSNGNGHVAQPPSAHPEYDTTWKNPVVEAIKLIDANGPRTANEVAQALGLELEVAREKLMGMVEDGDCVYEAAKNGSGEGTYARPGEGM